MSLGLLTGIESPGESVGYWHSIMPSAGCRAPSKHLLSRHATGACLVAAKFQGCVRVVSYPMTRLTWRMTNNSLRKILFLDRYDYYYYFWRYEIMFNSRSKNCIATVSFKIFLNKYCAKLLASFFSAFVKNPLISI